MELQASSELHNRRPDEWMIDLTPPEPWEERPSLEETLDDIVKMYEGLGNAYAEGIRQSFKAVMQAFAPVAQQAIKVLQGASYVAVWIDELEAMHEKQHGTHRTPVHKKPKVELPTRVTNSGPPKNQFAKRGSR